MVFKDKLKEKRIEAGLTQAELAKIAQRDPDYDNFVIGKHERLPIPQYEVDNNPNLKQNDNY